MNITNYIQERITEKQKIRRSLAPIRPTGDIEILLLISEIVELQAVLSKIEELGTGKPKSFFELDISLENPKIPEEQMEAFLIASEMRRIFETYNIVHSKLVLFPEGVTGGEIITGKIAGINVAYPRAK